MAEADARADAPADVAAGEPAPAHTHGDDHVDVDAAPAPAFGLAQALTPGVGPWHAHRKHQILYAARGTLHLEVPEAQWLLPPQRAAWIAAGARHRVEVRAPAALRTVYLAPPLLDGLEGQLTGGQGTPASCCVLAVTPLLRELLVYATRFGPASVPQDAACERFFAVIADQVRAAAAQAQRFWLPTARSPELRRAMRFTLDHLHLGEAVRLEDAALAARLSVRTLARRLETEARTTWRDFLLAARMLRAMELLAQPGAQVTETALAVGYDSVGAFTRAFTEFAGERPKDYRHRVAQ